MKNEELENIFQAQITLINSFMNKDEGLSEEGFSEEEFEKQMNTFFEENGIDTPEKQEKFGSYMIWRTTEGSYMDEEDYNPDEHRKFDEFEDWRTNG